MNNFKLNSSAVLLGASEVVFIAFPMLSMIVMNTFLTTAQYGELVYSFTLCSFYMMFVVFGVDILGSRLIHDSEKPLSVYCEITIFKGINFFVGFLPFILVLYYLGNLDKTIWFLPMVISEVFGLSVYFLGRDATYSLLKYRLLSKGAGVLSLTLFLIVGFGAISYALSLFCTMIIEIILFYYIIRGRSKITFTREKYLVYLKESWPLALSSLLVLGVSGGTRVYMNNVFGSAALGLFDIFDRVIRGVKVVQLVYNKYLVTVMVDSYVDIVKYLKISLLLNVVLTIVLYLLFYSVLPFIFSPEDLNVLMKYVHLVPTVLWVGLSQYLSFVLTVIWRKSFLQLISLVVGFGLFYAVILIVEIGSINFLVYLINIQELVVLTTLAIACIILFKRRKYMTTPKANLIF